MRAGGRWRSGKGHVGALSGVSGMAGRAVGGQRRRARCRVHQGVGKCTASRESRQVDGANRAPLHPWAIDRGPMPGLAGVFPIGMVYGVGAETAFLALWRIDIGLFVDYARGVAKHDEAKQQKAVTDLVGHARDFGAFLSSANPKLAKDAGAGLVKTHVLTLKDVVDAQAKGDQAKAFTALRAAAGHMTMITDPLAMAIAKQFPERFSNRPFRASYCPGKRARRPVATNPPGRRAVIYVWLGVDLERPGASPCARQPAAERRRRGTLPFFLTRSFPLREALWPTAIGTTSGTSTGSLPHAPPTFGCLYTYRSPP